ncbi:hypothetical protein KFK09_029268 [Dendrobium nobile]|uniref:Uncharacterized protein n=1 Tax=Dendrobium nobile TaxID=94219 RepID=A0A8T3A3Y3_DENNO|nr:hypothetical protein KFK09_029268 [Dendrobium nobile]
MSSVCYFLCKTPIYVQIIFGNRWRLLLGERDFWEHIGGIDVCLDPCSFGQANTQVNIKLCKMCLYTLQKGKKILIINFTIMQMHMQANLSVQKELKCYILYFFLSKLIEVSCHDFR